MRRFAMTEATFVIAVPTALAAGCALYAAVERWRERRHPRRGVEVVDPAKYLAALAQVDADRMAMADLQMQLAAAEAALEEERRPRSEDEETARAAANWLAVRARRGELRG